MAPVSLSLAVLKTKKRKKKEKRKRNLGTELLASIPLFDNSNTIKRTPQREPIEIIKVHGNLNHWVRVLNLHCIRQRNRLPPIRPEALRLVAVLPVDKNGHLHCFQERVVITGIVESGGALDAVAGLEVGVAVEGYDGGRCSEDVKEAGAGERGKAVVSVGDNGGRGDAVYDVDVPRIAEIAGFEAAVGDDIGGAGGRGFSG